MSQNIQNSMKGFNREELSTESSLEELSQEELQTITGSGPVGIGAGVGALGGAALMGGPTAGVVKKAGGTNEQAAGYGVGMGALGAVGGAGVGTAVGGIIDNNRDLKMIKNFKR